MEFIELGGPKFFYLAAGHARGRIQWQDARSASGVHALACEGPLGRGSSRQCRDEESERTDAVIGGDDDGAARRSYRRIVHDPTGGGAVFELSAVDRHILR